jgi:hypothetical protein
VSHEGLLHSLSPPTWRLETEKVQIKLRGKMQLREKLSAQMAR